MITIRRAEQEDRESIWTIHTRAIEELCASHYHRDELQSWSEVLKPIRYQAAISNDIFFVAEEDHSIVGFGHLIQKSGDVEAVYVSPDHARRGIGTRLLDVLEGEGRKSGLSSLQLWATLNAVPFYQSAGYQAQELEKYLLAFGRVTCVYMTKELD
jgi:N-acetylglutamate synthase-like GNAT family acetyltransferase